MIHSSLYMNIFLLDFWKFKCLAYINIVRKGFPDLLEIVKNGTAGAAGKEGVQVVHLHCHKIILRQFTAGQTLHNLFANININLMRYKKVTDWSKFIDFAEFYSEAVKLLTDWSYHLNGHSRFTNLGITLVFLVFSLIIFIPVDVFYDNSWKQVAKVPFGDLAWRCAVEENFIFKLQKYVSAIILCSNCIFAFFSSKKKYVFNCIAMKIHLFTNWMLILINWVWSVKRKSVEHILWKVGRVVGQWETAVDLSGWASASFPVCISVQLCPAVTHTNASLVCFLSLSHGPCIYVSSLTHCSGGSDTVWDKDADTGTDTTSDTETDSNTDTTEYICSPFCSPTTLLALPQGTHGTLQSILWHQIGWISVHFIGRGTSCAIFALYVCVCPMSTMDPALIIMVARVAKCHG